MGGQLSLIGSEQRMTNNHWFELSDIDPQFKMNREQFQSLFGTRHLLTNKYGFEIRSIFIRNEKEVEVSLNIKVLKQYGGTEYHNLPSSLRFSPNKNLSCDELVVDLKKIMMKYLTRKANKCYCVIYYKCYVCKDKESMEKRIIHEGKKIEGDLWGVRREYMEKYGKRALEKLDKLRRERIDKEDSIWLDQPSSK
jgi:hypothetical protein